MSVGCWGPGLYASDIAMDTRDVLRGLLRLPLSVDEIVAAAEREIGPLDDERAVFRLVAADQLERAGLLTDAVREAALETIAAGTDLAGVAEAGMAAADLKKRTAAVALLAGRLRAPRPARPRRVLKKPQALLFEPGDVLAVPVRDGSPYNPYMGRRPVEWVPDGELRAAVAATGHALGYLGWYAVVVSPAGGAATSKTTVAPGPAGAGCLTAEHASRMGLSRISRQVTDGMVLSHTAEELECAGRSAAILSISLSNALAFPMHRPESETQ
jgi:hypothetical protein